MKNNINRAYQPNLPTMHLMPTMPHPAAAIIALRLADILRLAEAYADTQARALKDTQPEHKAMLQDVAQQWNIPMVEMWIELALGELSSLVAGYEKAPVASTNIHTSDSVGGQEAYSIALKVPPTLPQSSLSHVSRQMLQYLACRVLEEHTSLTLPDLANLWQSKAAAAASAIEDALKERTLYLPIRHNPW